LPVQVGLFAVFTFIFNMEVRVAPHLGWVVLEYTHQLWVSSTLKKVMRDRVKTSLINAPMDPCTLVTNKTNVIFVLICKFTPEFQLLHNR
jgi:hypothetical protein